MKDLSEIMRQAQQMQARLQEAQQKMEELSAEGTSGGGMVKAVLKGKGDLASLTIDPSILNANDKEIIEDLVKAAHADARRRGESTDRRGAAGVPGRAGRERG